MILTYIAIVIVAVKFVTCDGNNVANKIGFKGNHIYYEDIK